MSIVEREVLDRNEEENKLSKALSRSYEELQILQTLNLYYVYCRAWSAR